MSLLSWYTSRPRSDTSPSSSILSMNWYDGKNTAVFTWTELTVLIRSSLRRL